jgi:SAM-dependent methyltransferase
MNQYQLSINTKYPVALDSPDHVFPAGTRGDNTTSLRFINEIQSKLANGNRRSLNIMDLGCAGGMLVHDFVKRGHVAIGLEGSDFNVKYANAEWPKLYQKNLFTCDISKPFDVNIQDDLGSQPFLCDLIMAWEVIEHIYPGRLPIFFENIRKHLKPDGQFLAGISTGDGPPQHQSVFSENKWKNEILNHLDGLVLKDYPYQYQNHYSGASIYIMLERNRG